MRNNRKKERILAEINITPFTDVILVLLIVFMIATPLLMQNSIKVALPKAAQSEEAPKNIAVTIDEKGTVIIDRTQYSLPEGEEQIKMKILAMMATSRNASVVINGDKNVKYDFVIKVMDLAKQAGVEHILLGIELEKAK